MQRLIWIGFALLATLWTLLTLAAHALSEWALQAVAGSSLGDLAARAAESPATQWLLPWIGVDAVVALQNSMLTLAGWLHDGLPALGALDAWIGPLIWIAWGMGMILLLAGALLARWALKGAADLSTLRQRQHA